MAKKCSTDQRFIRKRNTTYKIHTLVKYCLFLYFAEDEGDATRIEENKENTQIKIHINDQTEMEIVTQDVDEDNDEEKASEKVMSETEMDKNNSAIESNPESMETEEPAKIDDDAIATKSDEILDQGKYVE